MTLNINKDDVIKLILQYLSENGLTQSYNTLSTESNIALNFLNDEQQFLQDIRYGRWDQVLRTVKQMHLPRCKLMDLYEILISELLELNDRQTALIILTEVVKQDGLGEVFVERFNRLDYLIRKPGDIDLLQLYQDALSKDLRRERLAQSMQNEITRAPPNRLLSLLGDALRYQYGNKGAQGVDIFMGNAFAGIEEKQDKLITRVSKIIKYNEQVRLQTATFSCDGTLLITGSVDGVIEVWDPITQQLRNDLDYQAADKFMLHNSPILDLAITENNQLLASVDQNLIKVWKLQTGKVVKKIQNTLGKPVRCVAWGKNAEDLLYGAHDIHLMNLKSSFVIKKFIGHTAAVNQISTGSQVYSCSDDGTLRIWDYTSCENVFVLKPPQLENQGLVYMVRGIDQKQFIICSRSRSLLLVNQTMQIQKCYNMPDDLTGEFISCGRSAKGSLVYGLTNKSFLVIYEWNSGQLVKQMQVNDATACFLPHPHLNNAFLFTNKGELYFMKH